mgnify:CR=1 FL=1
MARPQGGLGRGIGALIPPADPRGKPRGESSLRPDESRQRPASDGYVEIPLEAIAVNQLQPRKVFEDDALRVLADSIRRFILTDKPSISPGSANKQLTSSITHSGIHERRVETHANPWD